MGVRSADFAFGRVVRSEDVESEADERSVKARAALEAATVRTPLRRAKESPRTANIAGWLGESDWFV